MLYMIFFLDTAYVQGKGYIMLFHKIDFAKIILDQYAQTWFMWIGFFILGVLLVKYAENITATRRETNKMESAGAGLIAIALVVHFGAIWCLVSI